jgi:prepilin-type N-terminal cleavage/methylation domain-containing protein/prepilin-type processing-associated H-X9-DG protein
VKTAFTLLEVLFSLAVVALLFAVAIPATSRATLYASRTKSIANLRQLGVAAHLYANDHDQKLPGAAPANPLLPLPIGGAAPTDRWPALFCSYLSPNDPRVFLDPSDPVTAKLPLAAILSNDVNNTGYIYNGFDELMQDSQPASDVPLTMIEHPTAVVLMSQKVQNCKTFYVDLLSSPLSLLTSVLNPSAYNGGSHYLYVDGSVRYLKQEEYNNNLWLVNKDFQLPPLLNSMRPQIAQGNPLPSGGAPEPSS